METMNIEKWKLACMFPVSSDKSLLLRDSRDSADSRDTSQNPKKIKSI